MPRDVPRIVLEVAWRLAVLVGIGAMTYMVTGCGDNHEIATLIDANLELNVCGSIPDTGVDAQP